MPKEAQALPDPQPFSPWNLAPFKGGSSGSVKRDPLAAAWCSPDGLAQERGHSQQPCGQWKWTLGSLQERRNRRALRDDEGVTGNSREGSAREGKKEQDETLGLLPGRLRATEIENIWVYHSI